MKHLENLKTASDLLAAGYLRLSADDFLSRISGRNFKGLFRQPFSYVMSVDAAGGVWGENNYGTQDRGEWKMDTKTGGFTVTWDGPWENHTTFAYSDGGAMHLCDSTTGQWLTSFEVEISDDEIAQFQNAPIHLKG